MKLFILVKNSGDGTSFLRYCFDKSILDKLESLVRDGDISPIDCPGFGGDGFDYNTLEIPDNCSITSLGIDSNHVITEESIELLINPEYNRELKREKEKCNLVTELTHLNRKMLRGDATDEDKAHRQKLLKLIKEF